MIKSITYKYGTANVLFHEGKARPFQITASPNHDLSAPSRMVSLKTKAAVIKRLNSHHEARMADVAIKRI